MNRQPLIFGKTCITGASAALRGMRNPLESWDRSDSRFSFSEYGESFALGDNDRRLALALIRGGAEERKFLRMIHVSVDITAPTLWWIEFDTYKVGTVANSTSTMHRLGSRLLTREDFMTDSWNEFNATQLDYLNGLVSQWKETGNKDIWRKLVQDLPRSFKYTRTIDLNYEVILTMLHQRRRHKLDEWSEDFCRWALTLPHMADFFAAAENKEYIAAPPQG